jgi:hypothetical protein
MLSLGENIVIVISAVAVALLFTRLLNKLWPVDIRRAQNDLIGWQLTVLGTTYAVILGFMLLTVWTNYCNADVNVDSEANALLNLYRLSDGLPAEQRAQLQQETRAYADTAITRDWPQMANSEVPDGTGKVNSSMWKTLMSVKSATAIEATAVDHSISEIRELTEHRHQRLLQSAARLPGMLWSVLLIGGILTIASASMFGAQSSILHALQVFSFSLLVSLSLVAVADINRPFQGSVCVDSYAFQRAQHDMLPSSN